MDYKKILIIGCSGAGKSTLAVKLGQMTGLPVVHLDKLWWLPKWRERTIEEFDELLNEQLLKPCWIMDGNFRRTFEKRLQFADFCIFLDYPTDLCYKSAYERYERYKGRTRPDMTEGCEEKFDGEFAQWIKSFAEKFRPDMLNALKSSGVPYKVFTDREQTQKWLGGLL